MSVKREKIRNVDREKESDIHNEKKLWNRMEEYVKEKWKMMDRT